MLVGLIVGPRRFVEQEWGSCRTLEYEVGSPHREDHEWWISPMQCLFPFDGVRKSVFRKAVLIFESVLVISSPCTAAAIAVMWAVQPDFITRGYGYGHVGDVGALMVHINLADDAILLFRLCI